MSFAPAFNLDIIQLNTTHCNIILKHDTLAAIRWQICRLSGYLLTKSHICIRYTKLI